MGERTFLTLTTTLTTTMTSSEVSSSTAPDVIDQAVPLAAHQASYAVRQQRAKVAAATQGSYEAMFASSVQGITVTERLAVALHACQLSKAARLSAHYRERLVAEGVESALLASLDRADMGSVKDPRLQTILRFTTTLIERPIAGDRHAVETLVAAGLSTPAIVALGQLIAFLSYQIRLTAGLQAMVALESAS